MIIGFYLQFNLPKPEALINHVPLHVLPKYMPLLKQKEKERLMQALITRHKNKCKRSLTRVCRIKNTFCKPWQAAQSRGHIAAALTLDFQNYTHYKKKIKEGYRELFK